MSPPLFIDALLLFVLSIPVVMKYRILPMEGTPYWLFGILFLVLIVNVILSLEPKIVGGIARAMKVKYLLFAAVLVIVIGGSSITAIVDRSKTAPTFEVHDIILQQEAAMRYLLQGKNPYKETYFGTPMEQWHYGELGKDAVNPALYHFVMPPWYLLFPYFFYFFSIPIFGFFDGRMVLIFCITALMIILLRWFSDKKIGLITSTLVALSPGVIDYFIEGRSDIFALFWFVWALYLLDRKKMFWSAIVFGLALMSKQTIWFAFPFYAVYLWWQQKRSLSKTVWYMGVMLAVCALLAGPFFLWNPRAFIDSVILYLSGGSAHGYPVSGYGLGMMLYEFNVIKDIHAYYPFAVWQIVLGLPTLGLSLWYLIRKPTLSRLLIGYAVTLSVIWYVSRYFNNSHLAYIGSILAIGIMKRWDEQIT